MKKQIRLSLVLLTAAALLLAVLSGCKKPEQATEAPETTAAPEVTDAASDETPEAPEANDPTELGEGAKTFTFLVTDKDGNTTTFRISTDGEKLADALLAHELIEGEESAYGLYVKKVNGITADYDVDQTYWALLIDGEMAMTGVSDTAVEDGRTYEFKVSK